MRHAFRAMLFKGFYLSLHEKLKTGIFYLTET